MESQFEGKQKFDELKNKQLTTVIFGDKMRTQNKSKLFCVLAVQLFIHTCICFKYPVRDKSAFPFLLLRARSDDKRIVDLKTGKSFLKKRNRADLAGQRVRTS